MQEIADILQAQGSLKTRDGKPYDVSSIVDLSWHCLLYTSRCV